MDILIGILKIFGAIGLFLYGMKLMSEAFQKVAGAKMRSIFAAMTSNRFLGVLTGLAVSATIQSSSATVLMVVSFVNAGLVSLVESIGVVMGANVGTTITGWIVAIFGYRFDISDFALPLMAVGFPLLFSKRPRTKSWGEAIVGFSILFVSLAFIQNTMPDFESNPEKLSFLSAYTDLGMWSVFIFVIIGALLTALIQSSGVTMVITFTMCASNIISFDLGAAMILGENIGTTIAPNLAASIGNISAKRTARFHLLFNLFGVFLALIFFRPFTSFVYNIVENVGNLVTKSPQSLVPISLALFHTMFNLANLLLFIFIVPAVAKVLTRLVTNKDGGEEFKLRYITSGILSTSELSIIQAKKELQFFAKHTSRMLGLNRKLLFEDNPKMRNRLFASIEKYENISDDVETEIANYLAKVSQGKLSENGKRRIRAMLKLVSELESIGDSNFRVARLIHQMQKKGLELSPKLRGNLHEYIHLIDEMLILMHHNLSIDEKKIKLEKVETLHQVIYEKYKEIKADYSANIEFDLPRQVGVYFIDMINEFNNIEGLSTNVSKVLYSVVIKKKDK